MSVDQQFNSLYEKLLLLLKHQSRLQKENEKLKTELDAANEKLGQHAAEMESLKQQVSILKISQGNFSEKDKKEFEKKISSYIKEIDRCISYLSQ